MVDRTALIEALEPLGEVVFCDENSGIYYLVVMNNYSSDEATFKGVADTYIVPDFPHLTAFSLLDGVLKAQYSIKAPTETE